MGVTIFAASVEKVWRLLKKFKIGLPPDWALPLFGMRCKDSIFYYRAICSFMAYSSIAMKCKLLRCPLADELVVKLWNNYKTVY